MLAGIIMLAVSYFLSLPSLQYWSVFCQGISPWALGTDVLLSTAYGAQAPSKTLLRSNIYSVIPRSCRNIPIRINYSLFLSLQAVVWFPCMFKMSLAHHVQVFCLFLWTVLVKLLMLIWGIHFPCLVKSRFWLQSTLCQTIGRLQHQLYGCHSCQMSH